MFWGNGTDKHMDLDGFCGAPIIDDESGKVLSLFRFIEDATNMGSSISSSVLDLRPVLCTKYEW